MASPTPLHNHGHHHYHLQPSLIQAIPSWRCCCCCCCCCVRRILLHHQHHHFHHRLFHAQVPPPWTPHGFPPFLVPRPGICPPPTLSCRADQCGDTAQDAVEAGGTLITSEDISSNRLQEGTWEEKIEGEEGLGEGGDEEEEEAVYVLTDEWAKFFAKSEAKRRLERKRKKQQQQKGSI